MKADIYERIQNLEDEVRLQDSTLDARTRKLWGEIQKLQTEVKELRDMNARFKGHACKCARLNDEK
ncbi:MAG: hypothetical protein Q7J24_06065 [Desulfomicrobium sp.]|nr:hypothetical protein [Desulfomicrobium sp.]